MPGFTDNPNYMPAGDPIVSKAPAGNHSDGIRVHKGRSSDIFETPLFHWIKKKLLSPGSGNYAWSSLGLVELSPIGPAFAPRNGEYKALQPPQLYLWGQAVPTIGIGGLAAGQYISQPLINYQDGTYGGVAVE